MKKGKTIILTVDVEDWFQVENFKKVIRYESWNDRESRVERNTISILDMLDSIQGHGGHKPRATFFVLGWTAEKFPNLVREISARGHEVASHGYMHHLCCNLSDKEIVSDLSRSKTLLEDIIGDDIVGYRAPSFNISHDTFEIIKKCGYRYDSSYNSFGGNDRYGKISLLDKKKNGILYEVAESFHEIPISNIKIKNKVIPWGGGGYFRLMPSLLFHFGVRKILSFEDAYVFYTHPWEVDPDQPKVDNIPLSYKFRHYVNLRKSHQKMVDFIETFYDCIFMTCREYLENKLSNN